MRSEASQREGGLGRGSGCNLLEQGGRNERRVLALFGRPLRSAGAGNEAGARMVSEWDRGLGHEERRDGSRKEKRVVFSFRPPKIWRGESCREERALEERQCKGSQREDSKSKGSGFGEQDGSTRAGARGRKERLFLPHTDRRRLGGVRIQDFRITRTWPMR